ncbi:hypothetical protein DSO57_1027590 [Entomophthora muscae]|uniref:Uncharacterized protein n=1 Tax=Entomophthora muscae TaxID=34485 RepID=A0ACC2UBB5_9FUNG|nr:hypothetical protein DSO57_1027590 [Entomophthora muscae]
MLMIGIPVGSTLAKFNLGSLLHSIGERLHNEWITNIDPSKPPKVTTKITKTTLLLPAWFLACGCPCLLHFYCLQFKKSSTLSKFYGDHCHDTPCFEACGIFLGSIPAAPVVNIARFVVKNSSSACLVEDNPSNLLNLLSGLLFSGEAIVKSLICNNLDLDAVDYTLPAPVGEEMLMSYLLSLQKNKLVPLQAPVVLPLTPTCTPWLLTGLVLMRLKAYFPQLSPVSSL